jgi:hypothetical protein
MEMWRRQRRSHRRRLLLSSGTAVSAMCVLVLWAVARVGGWATLTGHSALKGPGLPVLATALGAVAFLVWPTPDPERWARGAAGEIATAALLGRLARHRWTVLHDLALPGSRANIDHLVIGPTGVWVVDSKAFRGHVDVHWGRARVGGAPLATDAVRWEAEVVSDRLGVPARPIVTLHGRALPRRARRADGVTVVAASRLTKRLRRGAILHPALSARDVREIAARAQTQFGRAGAP